MIFRQKSKLWRHNDIFFKGLFKSVGAICKTLEKSKLFQFIITYAPPLSHSHKKHYRNLVKVTNLLTPLKWMINIWFSINAGFKKIE